MTRPLSGREKRAAKRIAKDVIGSPAPIWSVIGEDKKQEMLTQLLQQLRDTENTVIADAMKADEKLAWQVLQEKCKSMRAQETKANKQKQHEDDPTDGDKEV